MKFESFKKSLIDSIVQFPAELLTGAILGVDTAMDGDLFSPNVSWTLLLCIAAFSLNRWTRGRGMWRVAYWTVPAVALVAAIGMIKPSPLMVLMAATLLLVVPGIRSANDYRRVAWNTSIGIIISFGVGLGVTMLAMLTLWSAGELLGISIDSVSLWTCVAIFYVLVPLMCCVFITRHLPREPGALARVVSDYILAPFSLLYTLVLFVYAAHIIIEWQLPNGGVAWMVSVYVAFSLIGAMLHRKGDNNLIDFYYRLQPVLAILPLGLLWLGTVRRVVDYGWTADRISLVSLNVMLTVANMSAAMQRLQRNYRSYMLALLVVCAILAFAPYINARSLGIRAQQKRLQRVLPAVMDSETNRFVSGFDYMAIAADSLRADSIMRADAALDYLRANMDTSSFRQTYGQYGLYLNFNEWELAKARDIRSKVEVAEVDQPIFSAELNHPIELGNYTHYCPNSSYRYGDKGIINIYLDERCVLSYNLLVRVDSLRQTYGEVYADSILLYRTSEYLLVIQSINIHNHDDFRVDGLSLFTHPKQ